MRNLNTIVLSFEEYVFKSKQHYFRGKNTGIHGLSSQGPQTGTETVLQTQRYAINREAKNNLILLENIIVIKIN